MVLTGFLPKTPTTSRDTGLRKYFTAPVIDRIQRMASTGQSEFDLKELTEFHPRHDSPPYAISDRLLVKPPSNNDHGRVVVPDLSFSIARDSMPPLSAPIILGEYSYGATDEAVHWIVANVAMDTNILFGVGEGGVLRRILADQSLMDHIIIQNASGLFALSAEVARRARVVCKKYDQIAKKGIGGHLPKRKNKKPIAKQRGIPAGIDVLSDANLVFSIEEMRARAGLWPAVTGMDKPGLTKSGASHTICYAVAGAVRSGDNGMVVEGLGGGTGAAPVIHRDNIGLETEIATRLAHLQVQAMGPRDDFTIISGARIDSAAKAFKLLLLGADATLLGTTSLAAMGCKVVNLCGSNCLAGLAAIPELPDGTPMRQIDYAWGYSMLRNFVTAFTSELSQMLAAYGFATPKEARGRTDLLYGVEMPDELGRMLGIDYERPTHQVVSMAVPQPYLAKHRDALAESGKPIISAMGRTTDLDPPYSNLDLLPHEGRSIVGPAFDAHREVIETNIRVPIGGYTLSLPILLQDSGSDTITRLAREKNTIVVSDPADTLALDADVSRKVIPIKIANLETRLFQLRESSGVLLQASEATKANIHTIRVLSPSTPVFVSIEASENIREDASALASAGVSGIIISGTLSMGSKVSIDIAVSQADDELRRTTHENGQIQRQSVMLVAKTEIRSARDVFALNCLGADAVLCDISSQISNPTYNRKLTYLHGLHAELKLLIGASGPSMMSSVVGNRNILRASHSLPREIADLLGVDFVA